ncbi:MAG: acyl-CoA dehydrogenase family protein [Chloroflexi bacterium]|nr:acyl-CoA dehydrogenase family protein [Chloroflexota bacterium]
MDFEYSEEQAMVRRMAGEFVRQQIAPSAREVDREDRFPWEWVKAMAGLGFMGITAPSAYGGMGADRITYCIILEELAKGSAAAAVIAGIQNSFCETPILEWGNKAQKDKYLLGMVKGEVIGCLASTEPDHGSDPASMETTAQRQGTGYVINGSKTFITNGIYAHVCTTAAQTDKSLRHKGIVAFLVEKGHPGFTARNIEGKLGLKGTGLSELVFQDCRIAEDNVLGKSGEGFKILMSGMDDARLVISASAVGISQGCIEASISYAKQRKQFGKQIGSFQLVQGMIADMIVETEAARLLTYRAARLMDGGQRGRVETSHAKLYSSEMVQRVAYNAMQVHGGYGYIDEYPLERCFRDARSLSIIEGTSQVHRLIIGRQATGINAFA